MPTPDNAVLLLLLLLLLLPHRRVCVHPAFICVFVCLLATSHKNCWSDLRTIFPRDGSLGTEITIKLLVVKETNKKLVTLQGHSFIQNCCWITLQVSHHELKDERLVSKMEGKTWLIFRCAWNSVMAWPDWPQPPYFTTDLRQWVTRP